MGCYLDNEGNRDLPESVDIPWLEMTVGKCVEACRVRGYSYAGTQNGEAYNQGGRPNCFCGNSYGKHGMADGGFSNCKMLCPGNPRERCGGHNTFNGNNAVYRVQQEPALCGTGTCSAGGDGSGGAGGSNECTCPTDSSGAVCDVPGTCRFAWTSPWGDLATDTTMQEEYLADMLTWDGRFATPRYGLYSANVPITCDHVDLMSNGEPIAWATDCYTAPSKEALHLSMLALAVDRVSHAWRWIYDESATPPSQATNEASGAVLARARLTKIIAWYEAFDTAYPGLGGFIPWVTVGAGGFSLSSANGVELPGLDNGQLAWSMMAVERALRKEGVDTALADRYKAHVDKMLASAYTLFYNPAEDHARTFMISTVTDATSPVSTGNRAGIGVLGDPYEGEMMIVILDLFNTWADTTDRDKLWSMNRGNRVLVNYEDAGLPNGPISVQRGWRFSCHEQWKYLQLPYRDHSMADRVFMNGERARTWFSKLNSIPGLMGSAYDYEGTYIDRFGILPVSMGFMRPADELLMYTPYGAFPLILADRGHGLAWHRAMLARPQMQNSMGSTEAGQAYGVRVAKKMSWDTKVTADLAALGGTGALIKEVLQADATRWARWNTLLDELHSNSIYPQLQGEATPFAAAPAEWEMPWRRGLYADFPGCTDGNWSYEDDRPGLSYELVAARKWCDKAGGAQTVSGVVGYMSLTACQALCAATPSCDYLSVDVSAHRCEGFATCGTPTEQPNGAVVDTTNWLLLRRLTTTSTTVSTTTTTVTTTTGTSVLTTSTGSSSSVVYTTFLSGSWCDAGAGAEIVPGVFGIMPFAECQRRCTASSDCLFLCVDMVTKNCTGFSTCLQTTSTLQGLSASGSWVIYSKTIQDFFSITTSTTTIVSGISKVKSNHSRRSARPSMPSAMVVAAALSTPLSVLLLLRSGK